MADFDTQRICDLVVAAIKANIGTEVTEINALYADFDIAAPPTANYSIVLKEVLPTRPWVMVVGNVDIENVEGGGRLAWHDIEVAFVHDYPAACGDEELIMKYVARVGKAISQALKKKPQLGTTSDIITTLVSEQRLDDGTYSAGGVLRNVVVPIRVLEYEADVYPQ